MVPAILVFLLTSGAIIGSYALITALPDMLKRRKMELRLRDVSTSFDPAAAGGDGSVLAAANEGPLPAIDRMVGKTAAGLSLGKLIEQSGLQTTPSAIALLSIVCACLGALLAAVFTSYWFLVPIAAAVGGFAPIGFILHKRGSRMKKFEEHFPEALDLMSRALRAGHAFQSSMGMAGDELKPPVGPEFKKTFEQQNFGLPLRDALHQLTERVPLLDVRFFVTAVMIQRETGGNLSEILDNLAHVVRERFKIRRQVRVHTAHGRFTAFVLLSLPAGLAATLMTINPEHMEVLVKEPMGQMMLVATIIMQTVGFFWIRKVIKIEV
jgi:tight adherence protein B